MSLIAPLSWSGNFEVVEQIKSPAGAAYKNLGVWFIDNDGCELVSSFIKGNPGCLNLDEMKLGKQAQARY